VSDHDELRRTGLISGRSSCPHHRSPAARSGRLPGPLQRLRSRAHRIRAPLLPFLVRRARPGPLAARRPHLELYIRWMQEIRRFKPSTASRRSSVAAGFYRACVIDGLLEPSPAEHVGRPRVPAESPTLGFTHLQFEALLTAARESSHPCDFALVAMLGLLGLRSFEATGADIADLGEEHGMAASGTGSPLLRRAAVIVTNGRGPGPVSIQHRSVVSMSACGCASYSAGVSMGLQPLTPHQLEALATLSQRPGHAAGRRANWMEGCWRRRMSRWLAVRR
jgi:hypothetical protein